MKISVTITQGPDALLHASVPITKNFDPITGKWGRKYLCVGAVYRLLKRKHIGKARALALLATRHTPKEMKTLRGTVDLWHAYPIKDMLP